MELDAHAMVCILGNLLDNAIEAAVKAQVPQLGLEIKYDNQRLIIKVKNSYAAAIQWNGNMPQTSKKEQKLHGIGLKNVIAAVEGLGGEIHLTSQDNLFFALIIIPIEV